MIGNCNRWLVPFAAAYLALQATNFGTFWRSATFIGLVLLMACVWRARQSQPQSQPQPPNPDSIVLVPLVIWLAWSALTWFWSANPAYTRHELKGEVLDTALMIAAFYLAARSTAAFRVILGTTLASFAFFAALACVLSLSPWGWNPDRFHHGIGPFSTYLVLTAPLLVLLLAPPPAGFWRGPRSLALFTVALGLLIAGARLTNNRVVWLALIAVLVTIAIGASWRWPKALLRAWWRWAAPLAVIVFVLALAFLNTVRERTDLDYPPRTSVEEALAEDPRIALWTYTFEKIRERPWIGYGFGRKILATELTHDLRDPLLAHAHNIFISQWLQIGGIGLAAFVALLTTIAWRLTKFLRSRDDALAIVGLLGLALLTGTIVKNLTDDFMFGSNGREFWCLMAVFLGYGTCRERAVLAVEAPLAVSSAAPVHEFADDLHIR